MNTSEQPSSPTRHSCVDCGTQNCKYQNRTYPEFCPTTHLKEEDLQWALERYDEPSNHDIMVASAEVEYEGYCQWTRVQEIMEFARKIGARKIGIAHCIGLIREARIFARILQARLLNEARTDLNVVIGLCVGHDSLFYKYSEAYATTLVTKDRVTGNNPAAALYTAESYYRKKFGLER